jgi:uncharacterized protein YkwD
VRTWFVLGVVAGCSGDSGDATTDGGAPTVPEDWPAAWAAMEDEVVELCNVQRRFGATCGDTPMAGGLDLLESDEVLRGVARGHSLDMAVRGFFDHTNPDGDDPFDRIGAAGFTGDQPWGENIAAGSSTAADVVDQWMHSPGHCTNIMTPEFTVIGVGYDFEEDSEFRHYWTQNFAASH